MVELAKVTEKTFELAAAIPASFRYHIWIVTQLPLSFLKPVTCVIAWPP